MNQYPLFNQSLYSQSPSETFVESCYYHEIQYEDFQRIQTQALFTYFAIFYMSAPLLFIVCMQICESLKLIYPIFIQNINDEIQEDLQRLYSYFYKSDSNTKPSNLDPLICEMNEFLTELTNMKKLEPKTRTIHLKKFYIRTNVLTNKFRMKVYERLLEK